MEKGMMKTIIIGFFIMIALVIIGFYVLREVKKAMMLQAGKEVVSKVVQKTKPSFPGR